MITTLKLKAQNHRRVRGGHLWIFKDELQDVPELTSLSAGTVVRILTDYDYDLGLGFYHPTSQIAVRLLQTKELTDDFFQRRMKQALRLRERLFAPETAYRLLFGESDFLPGLVADRYGDYIALQFLSAGMDLRRDEIVASLRAVLPSIKGIIAKNDSSLRSKEGLPRVTELLYRTIPDEIEMQENGVRSMVSLSEGQKTGYFLDQRLNREFIATISRDLRVLDCFTNQGGFALHAAKGGASSVLGIDSSASAIESCRRNADLNNRSQCSFEVHDVFDYLKEQAAAAATWDMIILDPPAFTKSKAQVPQAKRGYAEINRQALKLIRDGGFLVSASCSHHISEQMLLEVIAEEGRRINRRLQLVYRGMQSPCHPIYLPMPETAYLKFFVFSVH